jgi:transcriptional regulatory protein RtcR
VREGKFREDLRARIHLCSFRLPSLRERPEDIELNLEYELDQFARRNGARVTFSREARARFLKFAVSPEALRLRKYLARFGLQWGRFSC